MRLTLKEVKAELAAIGVTIRKRDGEYRVNTKDGPERTAYYTDDLLDAVETAYRMRGKRRQVLSYVAPSEG